MDRLITIANKFGIWRDYPTCLTRDPDDSLTLDDLTSVAAPTNKTVGISSEEESWPNYWPFANLTIHEIMKWLNNGNSMKLEAETIKLVRNVFLSPDFDPEHLVGFNAHVENQRHNKELSKSELRQLFTDTHIDILVPSGDSGVPPKPFTVPGLLHCRLTSVIREAFNSPLSHLYHFLPFRLFQKSPVTNDPERIYGKIYTLDAFLEAHKKVQQAPVPSVRFSDCSDQTLWNWTCRYRFVYKFCSLSCFWTVFHK